LDVNIIVKDGEFQTNTSLKVNIVDDVPTSNDSAVTITVENSSINLVLTLDVSASMSSDLAGNKIGNNSNAVSRIELAKEAITNLINKYDENGEVKVLLTTFSNYGKTEKESGSVWLSASDAIDVINDLIADGGTNYDDALLNVIESMTAESAPLDGDTISYFFSDGVPTYGMHYDNGSWHRDGVGYSTTDVNDSIVNNWDNLDIDTMYAIGLGDSSLSTYLNEITPNNNVIIINEGDNLNATLSNMVPEPAISNSFSFTFGADGEADGTGINPDGDSLSLTWGIPTAMGTDAANITWDTTDNVLVGSMNNETVIKIEADMANENPQYTISKLTSALDIDNFFVPYTVTDADGDSSSSNLIINIVNSDDNTLLLENGISFDGLDGRDTLVVNGNTLDSSKIDNIEVLDLDANNNAISLSLSLSDIIDMTDENNVLEILGDDKDSIDFTDSGWSSQTGTGDDTGFDIYSNDQNASVQVKVEQDIPVI